MENTPFIKLQIVLSIIASQEVIYQKQMHSYIPTKNQTYVH